jgi:hypothetical protein
MRVKITEKFYHIEVLYKCFLLYKKVYLPFFPLSAGDFICGRGLTVPPILNEGKTLRWENTIVGEILTEELILIKAAQKDARLRFSVLPLKSLSPARQFLSRECVPRGGG